MAPASYSSFAFSLPSELIPWLPTWKTRPDSSSARIRSWPSAMSWTIGFSQYTAFPARSASTEIGWCQ